MTERRNKGEEPGLVLPTNDATLPSWGCQQQYPKPSWVRGAKYGGVTPTSKNIRLNKRGYCYLTHTKIWVWLFILMSLMCTAKAHSRSAPKCFIAVNGRKGWWNGRGQNQESRLPNIEYNPIEQTSRQGIYCSEAASYTLRNKNDHRYQPNAEAHRLAHKESAWPRAGINGKDLTTYKINSNTVNRKPTFNRRSSRTVMENSSLAKDGIKVIRTNLGIRNTANARKNNEEISETASHLFVRHLRHKSVITKRQNKVDAQRQTQRTNQIEHVTATAPRQSRELKLSSQEMEFRKAMEGQISMLRKRNRETDDTASEGSEDDQSASGVPNTDTDNAHVPQSGDHAEDNSRAQLGRELGAQSTENRAPNPTLIDIQPSVASPLPLSQPADTGVIPAKPIHDPGASSGNAQTGAPTVQAAAPVTNSEAPHGGQDTPTWYDPAWNVPTPDPDALPPSADLVHLRELVIQQDLDGGNTNEHLTAHRTVLEYLEPATDNWSDKLSSVLAKVQEGLIHHQGIIESNTAKLQPQRNHLTILLQDASQAQRAAEVRGIIESTVQVVWESTNAKQFLQQRVAVLTQQLERNAERLTLVAKELKATTKLIRANAKRVASKRSARSSPPAATSGKPSAAEDGKIALPLEGTEWPLAPSVNN